MITIALFSYIPISSHNQLTQGNQPREKKKSFLHYLTVPEVHLHLEFFHGVIYDLLVLFATSG